MDLLSERGQDPNRKAVSFGEVVQRRAFNVLEPHMNRDDSFQLVDITATPMKPKEQENKEAQTQSPPQPAEK